MIEIFSSWEAIFSLFTLTLLEIVLGIDNIIFIAILVSKLPENQQKKGRIIGLSLAMVTRILLLLSLFWLTKLTQPIFEFYKEFSGRDLVLIFGGLFLIIKSALEIFGKEEEKQLNIKKTNFFVIIFQIALIDIVFSIDSVITAVGVADQVLIMILAIILSVGVMMIASGAISNFVNRFESIKILALSFLILLGFSLVIEGLGIHISKSYMYFALFFSLFVEFLNLKRR